MVIAQVFFPSPLFVPVYNLALSRLRCDWESSIFSCDHDRKTRKNRSVYESVTDGEYDLRNWS